MGYTNYHYVKKGVTELPKEFLEDCCKVVKEWNKQHGCSAKLTIDCGPNLLVLDGPACTCENLVIDPDPNQRFAQPDREGNLFGFCKTRADEYDSAVKAIYMLGVKHGVLASWSFDGDISEPEYDDAVKLMKSCGFEPEPPSDD